MSASNKLRLFFINLTGYFIYKLKDLPGGVDLNEDLVNKFNIKCKTVFDVGANYGQTALYYSQTFKDARIYSFEPVKKSFLKLVNKTKHINTIQCFNIAFGEDKKDIEIILHDESNSQLNSLKIIDDLKIKTALKETITVDTLDNFVTEKNIEHIDLLKIDTEGFELEVLKGATQLLKSKQIKAILCEVALSKRNARNTQLNDVIDLLDTYDYFFVGLYETNVNYFKEGLAYSNALFISKK